MIQGQEGVVDVVKVLDVVRVISWMTYFSGSWVNGSLPVLPVTGYEFHGAANFWFDSWRSIIISHNSVGEFKESLKALKGGAVFNQLPEMGKCCQALILLSQG